MGGDRPPPEIARVRDEVDRGKRGWDSYKETIEYTYPSIEEINNQLMSMGIEVKKTTDYVGDFTDELSDLRLFIDGPLGKAEDDFIEQQQDVQEEMDGVRSEIQKALDQGYSPMGERD